MKCFPCTCIEGILILDQANLLSQLSFEPTMTASCWFRDLFSAGATRGGVYMVSGMELGYVPFLGHSTCCQFWDLIQIKIDGLDSNCCSSGYNIHYSLSLPAPIADGVDLRTLKHHYTS